MASDRSRSPGGHKGKGNDNKNEMAEFGDNFLALWAKHVEPKMEQKNKEERQLQEKTNREF